MPGPAEIHGDELEGDVVIVGTGAAGAMLAYELAERGRQVLMLERGSHVDPRDVHRERGRPSSRASTATVR